MSSTKFFRFPWATSGDKATIPDTVQPSGAVSYTQGFGPDYERDPLTDPLAKRVPRDESNQLYYDVTENLRAWQLAGLPEWVTSAQNGGAPVSYAINAMVRHNQSGTYLAYQSIVASNTAEPGTDATKWAVMDPFSYAAQEATLAEALAGSLGTKVITPRRLASAAQQGVWNYAVSGGAANVQTATLSPAPASISAGMELCLKITTPNTAAATLNVNGFGATPVVRSDGSPLVGGELNGFVELRYTGTTWQIMSVNSTSRLVLASDTTFYVNASTGSDSNSGTLAAPFLTLQYAWDFVQQRLDLGGKNVTISCAGAFSAGVVASGSCIGASSPTAVTFLGTGGATVATTSTNCFSSQFGASFRVSGFTLSATGGGSTLVCAQGQVTVGANMVFGSSSLAQINVTAGGVVNITNSYSIAGGAPAHYQCAFGYVFLQPSVVVTLTGTPAFGNAFAVFFQLGLFGVGSGVSFSGAATGFRYSVALNGVINTNAGGANFFPGSGAGSATTGGQYA